MLGLAFGGYELSGAFRRAAQASFDSGLETDMDGLIAAADADPQGGVVLQDGGQSVGGGTHDGQDDDGDETAPHMMMEDPESPFSERRHRDSLPRLSPGDGHGHRRPVPVSPGHRSSWGQ